MLVTFIFTIVLMRGYPLLRFSWDEASLSKPCEPLFAGPLTVPFTMTGIVSPLLNLWRYTKSMPGHDHPARKRSPNWLDPTAKRRASTAPRWSLHTTDDWAT